MDKWNGKGGLLVVQIGNATRLMNQLLKILAIHKILPPEVQVERVGCVEVKEAANQIERLINDRLPGVVVLVSDADTAMKLPEVGKILAKVGVPRLAMVKTKSSKLVNQLLDSSFEDCFVAPLREVTLWPRIIRHLPQVFNPNTDDPNRIINPIDAEIAPGILGESAAMKATFKELKIIGQSDLSVLITGETGTGKELCARAIHNASPRKAKKFNPLNCGAIPEELMENELFGHEGGAYTGALGKVAGLIEQTEGGTLLLDEIDALSMRAQVKLLRFLQEGESRALGSSKVKRSNVRAIAATNANLEKLVDAKRFRSDVMYRLNVFHMHLPPLREREGDVKLLANYFVELIVQRSRQTGLILSPESIRKLESYHWPGNVRQLRNLMEQTVARCGSGERLIKANQIMLPTIATDLKSLQSEKQSMVENFDRMRLTEYLRANGGNITRASRDAQMNRQVFARKMAKLGILRDGRPSNNSDSQSSG